MVAPAFYHSQIEKSQKTLYGVNFKAISELHFNVLFDDSRTKTLDSIVLNLIMGFLSFLFDDVSPGFRS